MTANPQIPTARGAALDILDAVLHRRKALDDAIDEVAGLPTLSQRDRAFARLLAATVLRRLGQIDVLISLCLTTPLPARAAPVQDMLRLGVAQLLFLRTPAHAAVATSVDLAELRGFVSHKGLVNAVLRRLSQDGPALVEKQDAAQLNTPKWLWNAWSTAYGSDVARQIGEAHMREAPLDITVRGDLEEWAERLEAKILPTGTLRRAAGGPISNLMGYAEGAWWIQDAAAALPVKLFGDIAGKNVLDLCAAPGGKSAQLAAAGALVTAVDRSPKRLERMAQNFRRIGMEVTAVNADAITWRPGFLADAVLLDAPCSATGAIRRHPDVAYLKTPDDVVRLAMVQERLLHSAIDMLAPGGTLVYCTCSIEAEEGPNQIERLLAGNAPVRRQPVTPGEVGGLAELITPSGDLRSLPSHLAEFDGVDGFYAARLIKTA